MRWTRILGLVLLVLGLAMITLRTFGYTRQRHSLKSETLEIHVEKRERLPVPAWIGVSLVVVGGALLLVPFGTRR